jgi:hypothetical protein
VRRGELIGICSLVIYVGAADWTRTEVLVPSVL